MLYELAVAALGFGLVYICGTVYGVAGAFTGLSAAPPTALSLWYLCVLGRLKIPVRRYVYDGVVKGSGPAPVAMVVLLPLEPWLAGQRNVIHLAGIGAACVILKFGASIFFVLVPRMRRRLLTIISSIALEHRQVDG